MEEREREKKRIERKEEVMMERRIFFSILTNAILGSRLAVLSEKRAESSMSPVVTSTRKDTRSKNRSEP